MVFDTYYSPSLEQSAFGRPQAHIHRSTLESDCSTLISPFNLQVDQHQRPHRARTPSISSLGAAAGRLQSARSVSSSRTTQHCNGNKSHQNTLQDSTRHIPLCSAKSPGAFRSWSSRELLHSCQIYLKLSRSNSRLFLQGHRLSGKAQKLISKGALGKSSCFVA